MCFVLPFTSTFNKNSNNNELNIFVLLFVDKLSGQHLNKTKNRRILEASKNVQIADFNVSKFIRIIWFLEDETTLYNYRLRHGIIQDQVPMITTSALSGKVGGVDKSLINCFLWTFKSLNRFFFILNIT